MRIRREEKQLRCYSGDGWAGRHVIRGIPDKFGGMGVCRGEKRRIGSIVDDAVRS